MTIFTSESYLSFDIDTCIINPNQLLSGVFQITQGDKISLGVRVGDHHLDEQLGLAFVYSKLMQLIYPDHTLEPLDANFTLPNTKYRERFENLVQLKQFIRMNDMGFFQDEKGTDFFCHTILPFCSWGGVHYQNNPVGFGNVKFTGHIAQDEYHAIPELLRIDVLDQMDNGAIPLINTMILDQCFTHNTLPICSNFNWNESTEIA